MTGRRSQLKIMRFESFLLQLKNGDSSLSRGSGCLWLVCIGLVSMLLIRLAFSSPMITQDSKLYLRLSDNLVINHCFSTSDVQTAECKPSWGVSQAPGYSIFISFIKLLVGTDLLQEAFARKLLFVQAAVFALAAMTVLLGIVFLA